MQQTSYFQDEVLAAAVQDGTLGQLYWFVEVEFPKRMLPPGIKRRQPAQWPHGCIPVIAAGPDPAVQREWAEMLAAVFAGGNVGRGITFRPALTSQDLLAGLRWYEYGEQPQQEIDHVCAKCGQVHRAGAVATIRCECYEW